MKAHAEYLRGQASRSKGPDVPDVDVLVTLWALTPPQIRPKPVRERGSRWSKRIFWVFSLPRLVSCQKVLQNRVFLVGLGRCGSFLLKIKRQRFFQLCGRDLDFRVLKTAILLLFCFGDQVWSVSGTVSAQNGSKKGPKTGSLKSFRKMDIRHVLSRARQVRDLAPSAQLWEKNQIRKSKKH